MNFLKLLCYTIDHMWVEDKSDILLPRRKCASCGEEQVYLTGVGSIHKGWIKAKVRNNI